MKRFLLCFEIPVIVLAIILVSLPIIELELNKGKFLGIMNNLEKSETCSELRALFDRSYDYVELLDWEHEKLVYTAESIERYEDPLQIVEYGKGRCQEFAILYVALTLAHGYQSRLVMDIYGDHSWAEINSQGVWTHIDPTEKRVDDPFMYERDWGKNLRLVLAFGSGTIEDMTPSYKMQR